MFTFLKATSIVGVVIVRPKVGRNDCVCASIRGRRGNGRPDWNSFRTMRKNEAGAVGNVENERIRVLVISD